MKRSVYLFLAFSLIALSFLGYTLLNLKKLHITILHPRGNLSRIYSPKHKDADGFDVHQIRGTYYSLLDCDDDAYIAARAIQLFVPGIPQVYYVGLLAGENDTEAYAEEGDGRVINRHNYSVSEIKQSAQKAVVQRLIRLIKFRNTYPAFNGIFSFDQTKEDRICMHWKKGKAECALEIDLEKMKTSIHFVDKQGVKKPFDA